MKHPEDEKRPPKKPLPVRPYNLGYAPLTDEELVELNRFMDELLAEPPSQSVIS